MKYRFYIRERQMEPWDSCPKWSKSGVIASNELEAWNFWAEKFKISSSLDNKIFYRFKAYPYRGSKPNGIFIA